MTILASLASPVTVLKISRVLLTQRVQLNLSRNSLVLQTLISVVTVLMRQPGTAPSLVPQAVTLTVPKERPVSHTHHAQTAIHSCVDTPGTMRQARALILALQASMMTALLE